MSADAYDAHATRVIEETAADAVVLLVLGGSEGSHFAVQSTIGDCTTSLVAAIRDMADQIEAGELRQVAHDGSCTCPQCELSAEKK